VGARFFNSASCERVFSLLKVLFGEQQMSVLADYIRAALIRCATTSGAARARWALG